MGWRVGAAALLLLIVTACGKSPTSPSGDLTLTVRVIDETTGQPITDPVYRLELQLAGADRSYAQTVSNGSAIFPNVAAGEYRLTTSSLFGYLQLDLLNVTVDETESMTLLLTPIDDLGVEQVLVDGQGSVPPNGTIRIPLRGVTLRLRGKYQSPRSPWPERNGFSAIIRSADPAIDGFGHDGTPGPSSQALSPDEFEIVIPNWTPCTRFANGRLDRCFTSSDVLVLTIRTPFVGGFGGSPLYRKFQSWPLKYDLVTGCCLP